MVELLERRESQVTLRDFLIVVFRRKWIILAMVGVTSTVVCTALMMTPVVYTSNAKIMVHGLQRGNPLDGRIIQQNSEEILSSERELIRSRPIMERAQEILDSKAMPGEKPYRVGSARVRANSLPKSRILFLTYTASTSEEAKEVTEAVTAAYMSYHGELFALPDLGDFFSTELSRAQERTTELLNRRYELKAANEVPDVSGELGSSYSLLTTLRNTQVVLERDIAALRSEIALCEASMQSGDADPQFLGGPRLDPYVLESYMQDLVGKKVERERLLSIYTDRHPSVVALTKAIEERERSVMKEAERMIALKRSELASKESELSVLRDQISEIDERLMILPAIERDLTELDRGIQSSQRFYESLIEMQARAAANAHSSADYHVTLLSPAGPGQPSNPRDMVRMSLGPLLSLLVGIGLAFFFDSIDHSLKNPEEVERYLELPVLTSVKRRPISSMIGV